MKILEIILRVKWRIITTSRTAYGHLVAAFWGLLAAAGIWAWFGMLVYLKYEKVFELEGGGSVGVVIIRDLPDYVFVIVGIISLLAAAWFYLKNLERAALSG